MDGGLYRPPIRRTPRGSWPSVAVAEALTPCPWPCDGARISVSATFPRVLLFIPGVTGPSAPVSSPPAEAGRGAKLHIDDCAESPPTEPPKTPADASRTAFYPAGTSQREGRFISVWPALSPPSMGFRSRTGQKLTLSVASVACRPRYARLEAPPIGEGRRGSENRLANRGMYVIRN